MTAKSHTTTTLAIGILPIYFYGYEILYIFDYLAIYLIGLVVGSLLPDIEESHSYIGRKAVWLSSRLNKAIGHRKITHRITVYIPIFFISYYMSLNSNSYVYIFLIGFSLGSILHSLEDCLTDGGVSEAMKPFIKNFVLLKREWRFNTNGKFENFIYYPIISIIFLTEVAFYLRLLFFHIKG